MVNNVAQYSYCNSYDIIPRDRKVGERELIRERNSHIYQCGLITIKRLDSDCLMPSQTLLESPNPLSYGQGCFYTEDDTKSLDLRQA